MLQIPDITDDTKDPIVRTVKRKPRKRVPLEKKPWSQLQRIKWKLFSEWFRLAHASKSGRCQCITCRWTSTWNRGMHVGHYHHSSRPWLRYHFWNVGTQCNNCNTGMDGAHAAYAGYLEERHGRAVIQKLDAAGIDPPLETRQTLLRDIRELRVNLKAVKDYRKSMGWQI